MKHIPQSNEVVMDMVMMFFKLVLLGIFTLGFFIVESHVLWMPFIYVKCFYTHSPSPQHANKNSVLKKTKFLSSSM